MRQMYAEAFEDESVKLTIEEFWHNVYFMIDDEWYITSPTALRERFGWVLRYITEGEHTQEARHFMDALREVWSEEGTVLRSATHPYEAMKTYATGNEQHPDLCPRWVSAMMANNVMSKIQAVLSQSYGYQIPEHKVSSSYGILIAVLWEEAYTNGLLVMDSEATVETSAGAEFNFKDAYHEAAEHEDAEYAGVENADLDQLATDYPSAQIAEKIKEIISRLYHSGNGMVWA
jgi:hypothetical protein